MKILLSKYQGTGNDFIMLDNLTGEYDALTLDQIQLLCDRKLGIGADGLIKISKDPEFDFTVEYFNSDGSQSFCGNGARCSVAFSKQLGIVQESTKFRAIDGRHEAKATVDGRVHLEMLPVENVSQEVRKDDEIVYIIDTGSPHYIQFSSTEDVPDIVSLGKKVRYSDRFKKEGINVNTLVELGPDTIHVATYERGVEDETLSCGTGVTACALAYMHHHKKEGTINVSTKGGRLSVKAKMNGEGFDSIWLIGPAKKVFDGSIEI